VQATRISFTLRFFLYRQPPLHLPAPAHHVLRAATSISGVCDDDVAVVGLDGRACGAWAWYCWRRAATTFLRSIYRLISAGDV